MLEPVGLQIGFVGADLVSARKGVNGPRPDKSVISKRNLYDALPANV